jgi:hypothetical protein
MQNTAVTAGATVVSVILRAFTVSTGAPKTDITHSTSGLELRYKRGAAGAVTSFSAVTQTSEGAHTDGGIVHLHGGLYRVDLPDAACQTGSPTPPWVVISAAGVADCLFTAAFVELMGSDPRAAALTPGALRDDALNMIANMTNAANTLTFKDSANANYVIGVTRAARDAIATTTPPSP